MQDKTMKEVTIEHIKSVTGESCYIDNDLILFEHFIIRKTKRSEKTKRSDVFRKTKCSFFDFPTHNLKTPQKTLGRFKFLNDKNLTHSNRTSRSHYHQAVALCAPNYYRICVHFRDSVLCSLMVGLSGVP